MSRSASKEDIMEPKTLQEATNIIKFLKTTHKSEIAKLKDSHAKQAAIIKKLEDNRKKELDFLSGELQKYEISLALRTETVKKQLAEKEEVIRKQADTIEELSKKLKAREEFRIPEIVVDSNSDSGVAMENDESSIKIEEIKPEIKATRKCSRRFADPIGFLRRVDFSPMKYKPNNREGGKNKKEEKKNSLEVPSTMKRVFTRQLSNERPMSDDDRIQEDAIFSDGTLEPIVVRPKNKLNDSMNNHFSDDGSDDTSEEIFDRVMTRSSIRRSVKANPKYKKINRSKSKLLEQVKVNIVD